MKQKSNTNQSGIDHSKRKTLKKITGISAGTIALTGSSALMAGFVNQASLADARRISLADDPTHDLADIELRTSVSAVTNDIEVVIKNTGQQTATITDMTPAEIHTARGKFDFNALFKGGSLVLESGEYVSVPLQHHKVVLSGDIADSSPTSISERVVFNRSFLNKSLRQKLESTVSITTDGDSLAVVSIVV